MFDNLIFEFKKNDIKVKDLAECLEIEEPILRKKLKGQDEFNINECLKLQKLIGNKNLCLEYLFKKR